MFKSRAEGIMVGTWLRTGERSSVNREEGGGNLRGLMVMMVVMITTLIEHLRDKALSSLHVLAYFTLTKPLKMEFIVYIYKDVQ